MADSILNFVEQKLKDALKGPVKDALINEGIFLYNVNDNAEAVQRELERIRSFLKDADSKNFDQERVRNWVKEVRGVAYRIEDAVDTFQAEVAWINYKEPGFFNGVKRLFRKSKLPWAFHTFGTELESIKESVKEISDGKANVGITTLEGGRSRRPRPIGQLILPDIGETEIVGFESDKDMIIGRLLDENNLRRSVVPIVGPGGIGKSTLAKTVYNNPVVKAGFGIHIWLSVSQEAHLIDLLKKMFAKLQPGNQRDYHELPEDYLMREIHASLKERKYLVVVDDIWAEELWNQLYTVFPDAKNGSRVLITSRFVNVAKIADPRPHELQFLNEEQSLQLLLNKAVPSKDLNVLYQENLLDQAKDFARKCGGLPLQLEELGSLLSREPLNYVSWKRFLQKLDWSTVGRKCLETVATSYENLPLHLKSLFMSFSVFPEDYEINAQSLISYWCTEGFIPHDGRGTMYEKAERYLEDLVDRCMVQVTERNTSTGFIERCRLHTLLRIIAVQEAKEKDFITIFWRQEDRQENARHASFHFHSPEIESNATENKATENKDVTEYTGLNVRTLMFFGKILPIQSRMKLLKVLIVYRASVTFDNGRHTWLENLIGLRHLEFRECELKDDTLPERIDCLHHLEYLDLTDTKIADLPKSIKCNEALKLVPATLKATPN